MGILFVAAACSGPVKSTAHSSPTVTALPAGVPQLNAGSHTARVLGGGRCPGYTVVVPDGWYDDRGLFTMKDPALGPRSVLALSVWDVARVYRDPCHWLVGVVDPGPSVDGLVAALVAQPLRNASRPTIVTLDGYSGRYLEWSVPADMTSSQQNKFDNCDPDPSDGNRYFESWQGNGSGDRYQQAPGQVDRLWVLDVHGQRLVVDATYSPNTSQADRDELGRVVESLRFVAS